MVLQCCRKVQKSCGVVRRKNEDRLLDGKVLLLELLKHGLQTPEEGIKQINLKSWANVADKICFHRTYKLGVGVDFRPCSEGDFFTGRPRFVSKCKSASLSSH